MHFIFIAVALLMFPVMSHASPCSDFPWLYPAEIVEPDMFRDAQHAMRSGQLSEARQLMSKFLNKHPEGALAKSGRWALASLPDEGEGGESDRDQRRVNIIDQLTVQKRNDPKSPYAPWALCRVGELYRELDWMTEANGVYEEFLETYPEHPLAGGVLLNGGYGFIREKEYIEAALTFRRMLQKPQWEKFHIRGALGLADATALSQAWQQASYWYQVVEVENPRLIRTSALSSYHYGLSEFELGRPFHGMKWFLTTYNLHQEKVEAGQALNHIGNLLLKKRREMAALWFFHEAAFQYKTKEPGRRGELSLIRWIVSYLSSDHPLDERKVLYEQFDALEIYLSVSWDYVVESTRILADSPEADIAEEAQFWLAQGYQKTGDDKGALETYQLLVESADNESWRRKAQVILTEIVLTKLRAHYAQQAWVDLIQTYDSQETVIGLLPKNLEWMRMVADAYRFVGLPRQALMRYEELLKQDLSPTEHEQILIWNVALAKDTAEEDTIRQAADAYTHSYPKGKQRAGVALMLGQLDMREGKAESAVKQFTLVMKHGLDKKLQQQGRRERAYAYQQLGRYDDAIADYRQLIKSNTVSVGIRLSFADLLYEQKRFAEAESVYKPVAKSDSKEEAIAWAQFRLAMCYQKVGKQKVAADLLEDLRQPGRDVKDLEMTIQSAAAAAIDEFVPTKSRS